MRNLCRLGERVKRLHNPTGVRGKLKWLHNPTGGNGNGYATHAALGGKGNGNGNWLWSAGSMEGVGEGGLAYIRFFTNSESEFFFHEETFRNIRNDKNTSPPQVEFHCSLDLCTCTLIIHPYHI